MHFPLISAVLWAGTHLVLADPSISSFPNSLTLSASFDPIQAAYWTGLPHHRRTPFAVSPDGASAYLAYLDSTKTNVLVQQVETTAFTAVGAPVTIVAYEAAGIVAQNDGFALMATINATGSSDLPTNNMPIVAVIRYKDGAEAWRTPLNGPGVHAADGLTATPDANGDLVYSPASGLYAAYFVVTAYTGTATGHFGDSVQYVDDAGVLQDIDSSSTFGCSHNTGIGLEAADAPPFASICAEDQGAIWLNTDTRYMDGEKIANENTTNGVSGEPMGGMSGSYSNLALFPSSTNYVFAWQSRGAKDLTTNDWLGSPFTQCSPRWLNHNVAISIMSSKNKLAGAEASSTVGAVDGDTQINWITKSDTEDHQNVHVAAINSGLALVTWETLLEPNCQPVPLGCSGTYAGTSFQLIDSAGAKVGAAVTDTKVFVSGDIANVGSDKVCWPYVDMNWDLSSPKDSGTPVTTMSFASSDPNFESAGATPNSSLVPIETEIPTSSHRLSKPPPGASVTDIPAVYTPALFIPKATPVVTSTADGVAYPPKNTSKPQSPEDTNTPLEAFPIAYPTGLSPPFPTGFSAAFPTSFWSKLFLPGSKAYFEGCIGRNRFHRCGATTFATVSRDLPTTAPANGEPYKQG
ncbi:hypothetical protein B2J93_5644 [Marssonina coronariae]|uniref:Uncharacterized protein n=1 Tax=Diplocarpon coronariae TaxID=2795749 RepID=A0A218ZD93_9HELO|nr:hypothetical protein B2J93_5644 [Marssonina coronariae]